MEEKELLFALSTCAYDYDNEAYAKHVAKQLDVEELQKLSKNLEVVTRSLHTSGKSCNSCVEKVRDNSERDNGILIFISFSMPKASIIELNNQAQKYNARLVIRGIYKDSFIRTKDKILEIEPKGLVIDIDPQLFKQYQIKRVPTFILLKDGKEIKRLSGNVTLEFAHKKLIGGGE